MQERSHAYAMKSQIWLLDPRPNLPTIVRDGRGGLRAVGGLEHAGDARSAHPRLPRARQLRRQGQQAGRASRCARRWRIRRATSTASCCRPPRSCTRRRRSSSAGRRRSNSSRSASSTRFFGPDDGDVGIIVLGRHVQRRDARAAAARPRRRLRRDRGAALRAQRRLSADRRGGGRVLPRQEGGADGRGGRARLSSSRRSTRSCAAATSRPRSRGKDVLPMGGEYTAAGADQGHRARSSPAMRRSCSATSRRCPIRPPCSPTRRSRRSPRSCRRGRRASASAARSGRSSPR